MGVLPVVIDWAIIQCLDAESSNASVFRKGHLAATATTAAALGDPEMED